MAPTAAGFPVAEESLTIEEGPWTVEGVLCLTSVRLSGCECEHDLASLGVAEAACNTSHRLACEDVIASKMLYDEAEHTPAC